MTAVIRIPEPVLVNGRVVATSLQIAEVFGKQHKNVIQSIESLDLPQDFGRLNFQPTEREWKNNLGKIVKDKAYNITRDGFTLLAMGFTGKEAMKFKIAYIERFNAMEEALRSGKAPEPPPALPEPEEDVFPKRIIHTQYRDEVCIGGGKMTTIRFQKQVIRILTFEDAPFQEWHYLDFCAAVGIANPDEEEDSTCLGTGTHVREFTDGKKIYKAKTLDFDTIVKYFMIPKHFRSNDDFTRWFFFNLLEALKEREKQFCPQVKCEAGSLYISSYEGKNIRMLNSHGEILFCFQDLVELLGIKSPYALLHLAPISRGTAKHRMEESGKRVYSLHFLNATAVLKLLEMVDAGIHFHKFICSKAGLPAPLSLPEDKGLRCSDPQAAMNSPVKKISPLNRIEAVYDNALGISREALQALQDLEKENIYLRKRLASR